MPHFIQQLNDHTLGITLSGIMGKEDMTALQVAARSLLAKRGKINVLIILQDFSGFGRSLDGVNLEFYADHGDDIMKMAIVGDPKWKAEAEVFTGKGARKTKVEFFSTDQFGKAHAWILAA